MIKLQAHIEVKIKDRWLHYGAPTIDTDHILFAFINGHGLEYIRESLTEDIRPCASISGLPKDISEITELSYNQGGTGEILYEEGCLTSEDLRSMQARMAYFAEAHDPRWKCNLETDIFRAYINNRPIADHTGYDDSRVVFWFSE